MEEKEKYTLDELYEELPCTIRELAKMSGLNEVTVARIRDGKPTRRSTVNKLLRTMGEVYKLPLSIRNVTGIAVQRNLRLERKDTSKRDEKENVA